MSINLVNVSLTLAGLVLIILFYLPVFRHLLKNTTQFLLYLIFWLLSLALITSVIDYMFFSNSKTDTIIKPNIEELEAWNLKSLPNAERSNYPCFNKSFQNSISQLVVSNLLPAFTFTHLFVSGSQIANFITDLPSKPVPEDTAIIKHAEITTRDKLMIVKQTLAYTDASLEEVSLTCSFSSIKEFIKKPFLVNKFQ